MLFTPLARLAIKNLLQPLVAGATVSDFGHVMFVAMKAVAGRASGDRVSAMARKLLGEK